MKIPCTPSPTSAPTLPQPTQFPTVANANYLQTAEPTYEAYPCEEVNSGNYIVSLYFLFLIVLIGSIVRLCYRRYRAREIAAQFANFTPRQKCQTCSSFFHHSLEGLSASFTTYY